jgi:hypothetical protein
MVLPGNGFVYGSRDVTRTFLSWGVESCLTLIYGCIDAYHRAFVFYVV